MDNNIIAFVLGCSDNGASYFEDASDKVLCQKCKTCVDVKYYPTNLQNLRKEQKYDISATYDGVIIVSERVVHFCYENSLENIEFVKVNCEPNMYKLEPKCILKFDCDKRKTRFINKCEVCGNYKEVIGATPAFLKEVSQPILKGIYRTDISFGSGCAKQPLIIVGIETKKVIDQQKFRGIDWNEVR